MCAAITITLTKSGLDLGIVLDRVRNKRGLMAVLGTEAKNQFIVNFRRLATKPNRLNAPSTHYYEGAADATHSDVIGNDTAVISTNQVGVRLHYLGGEVHPVTKKWLTIPAIAEAHGKRATEFQHLWLMKKGGQPIALCRTLSKDPPKFEVVYWLRKSVKHRADSTVFPDRAVLETALRNRAGAWLKRQLSREASSDN